ncbi:MAG: hypothetical protein PVSMB9_06050 [Candidatus Dormibacteria bacterium]
MTTSEVSSARVRARPPLGSEIIVLEPARMGLNCSDLQHRLAEAGLEAAIALVARRPGPPRGRGKLVNGSGRLRVDLVGRRVFVDESELRLSPKERDLLTYLLRRPGVAVTRTQLLHDVWGRDGSHTGKTVDVHVRWLRQRLAAYESLGVEIMTVRGTGYRLDLTSVTARQA